MTIMTKPWHQKLKWAKKHTKSERTSTIGRYWQYDSQYDSKIISTQPVHKGETQNHNNIPVKEQIIQIEHHYIKSIPNLSSWNRLGSFHVCGSFSFRVLAIGFPKATRHTKREGALLFNGSTSRRCHAGHIVDRAWWKWDRRGMRTACVLPPVAIQVGNAME